MVSREILTRALTELTKETDAIGLEAGPLPVKPRRRFLEPVAPREKLTRALTRLKEKETDCVKPRRLCPT